jgi:hypothetical protein
MKTITEFSGFGVLKAAFQLRDEIAPPTVIKVKKDGKDKQAQQEKKPIKLKLPTPKGAPVVEAKPEEVQAAQPEAQEVQEVKEEPKTEEAPVQEAAPVAEDPRAKLAQAFTEKFKLEGDKLEMLINAVEVIDRRKISDLKRIVVYEVAEGEKAPSGAVQKGSHHFLPEYLPSLNPPRDKGRGHKKFDRPHGKGGKGRGGKGRDQGGKPQFKDRGPTPKS